MGGGSASGHTFATATAITVDTPTQGMLNDFMTPDFYSFTAKAGERLYIQAIPTALKQFFDATLIDPALALFDSSMNIMMPLTFQYGANPFDGQSAVLYVQIPKDGTYYVQVADCNGFFMNAAMACRNNPMQIVDTSYNLAVVDTNKLSPAELIAATTQDGTTAKADAVVYKAAATAGQYFPNPLGGAWKSQTDTHVFSFTPPAAAKGPTGGRARADFYFQAVGGGTMTQGGDLSVANAKAWITDDAAGMHIISAASQSNYSGMTVPLDLSIPFTPGNTYYLFVQNTDAMAGTPVTDFYFVVHNMNSLFNVAEKEVLGMHTNDTTATAETLPAQGTAKTLFAVDGDISAPASAAVPDLDYYTFNVPTGITSYAYQCDAARSGSGLGGFTIELLQADGTTTFAAAGVETATADLNSGPTFVTLPSGVTPGSKMYVKLSAATQDTKNTGTMYRCYVFFN
jgi:hypothetical protein